MVCVLKEKKFKKKYRRKILGRTEKKKNSNSKKSGEGHTCLSWRGNTCLGQRGNQKTPWFEKKTNGN